MTQFETLFESFEVKTGDQLNIEKPRVESPSYTTDHSPFPLFCSSLRDDNRIPLISECKPSVTL